VVDHRGFRARVAPQALTAVLISVGILLAGAVYFAYLFISNREVLETEPGEVDVFKH
jgi:hypothetical protein